MNMNRRAAAGLGLALAACIALPAAQSAAGLASGAPILDGNAHPALDWSVPSRYNASWAAWNKTTHTYDANFVNPRGWSVNLNMCASTSLYRVTGYTVTLEQLGTTWKRTYTTPACTLNLHNLLPAQGSYATTVTLNTQVGLNPGVSAPLRRILGIKDHLIVSMGDSFASGEGNPDVPGQYDVTYDWRGKESSVHTRTAAQWKDENCHRSARSGPALAAKAFEDADPKTSVTFVSVACTGAELLNLTDFAYKGLPPQSTTVAAAVKAHDGLPARTIDALIVTAGVNDLHFSDIIERCASNWQDNSPSCVTSGGIADQLQQLPSKLLAVLAGLHAKLPNTRETYLSDYPDNPFRGGGCGSLGFTHAGISTAEAEAMHTYGIGLNNRISNMARALRNSPYNVNHLDLTSVPFYAHAYCASTPWFVHYEQSWSTQGDKLGTAHPNALGAQAYANQIRKLVVLNQVATPYRHLTVTIKAIKLAAKAGAPSRYVSEYLSEYQNDLNGLTRYVNVPQNGAWTPISAAQGTFKLDVYPTPSSPRHATGLYMSIDHILPIKGTLANAYNAGRHIAVHPTGAISVDYTVTVTTP